MTNWKDRKALYEIHEVGKGINEVYTVIMTGKEISEWCKTKNDMHGYIEGLGGDKKYSCWAVERTY